MVTRDEIRTLARLRDPQGVVSVYVAVRPGLMYDPMHPLAAFKGAVTDGLIEPSLKPGCWRQGFDRLALRV